MQKKNLLEVENSQEKILQRTSIVINFDAIFINFFPKFNGNICHKIRTLLFKGSLVSCLPLNQVIVKIIVCSANSYVHEMALIKFVL